MVYEKKYMYKIKRKGERIRVEWNVLQWRM